MAISNDSKKAIRWEIEKLTQLGRKLLVKKDQAKVRLDGLNSKLQQVQDAVNKLKGDLNG